MSKVTSLKEKMENDAKEQFEGLIALKQHLTDGLQSDSDHQQLLRSVNGQKTHNLKAIELEFHDISFDQQTMDQAISNLFEMRNQCFGQTHDHNETHCQQ